MIATVVLLTIVSLTFAAWCTYIAWHRNLNLVAYAVLGILLPIVGVIVAAAEPPRPPRSRCASCGAYPAR